jgi:hypothetical protein
VVRCDCQLMADEYFFTSSAQRRPHSRAPAA